MTAIVTGRVVRDAVRRRVRHVGKLRGIQTRDRAEAIALAGTDLGLLFDGSNTPFPCVDCARVHVAAILQVNA